MTMPKEYFQKYYQDHKISLNKSNKKWRKKNQLKTKIIQQRYRDKFLTKGRTTTNKSAYEVKSLKDSYLKRYGKSLNKIRDDVSGATYRIRVFCRDCINYKGSKFLDCPGWENCPYREEVSKLIKKGGKTSGKTT